MSDYKGKYITNSLVLKKKARKNKAYQKIRNDSLKRATKYKKMWKYANLDEIVKKFTPNPHIYTVKGKIIFSNNDKYMIVCDAFSSYFRIFDNYINDYITIEGICRESLPKETRETLTHYNISKRKKTK